MDTAMNIISQMEEKSIAFLNILEKNRKKLLGKIILPGVEILDED